MDTKANDDNIVDDLAERGLLHTTTNLTALRRHFETPRVVFAGFDPTADSLHLGNLQILMLLKRFQNHGHKVIALVGGATAQVGDPSGRKTERDLNEKTIIKNRVEAIRTQIQGILGADVPVVDNSDWTQEVTLLDFLRDVGKKANVNEMLDKTSVKDRLVTGLSFAEFTYMLLQANDFRWLNEHHNVTCQIGGQDQWGNITAGIDLAKKSGNGELFGVCVPLIVKQNGEKFGKSASGALWLDPAKTRPFDLWQHLFNVSDLEAETLLMQLTTLEVDKIRECCSMDTSTRARQTALADFVVEAVHGAKGLEEARAGKTLLEGASPRTLSELADSIPGITLSRQDLATLDVADLFVKSGLCGSKNEVRRLIAQNGCKLQQTAAGETWNADTPAQGIEATENVILLQRGKKQMACVRVCD